MERSERDDHGGLYEEPEVDGGPTATETEIDYTKSEGYPTPHAVLNVALKLIGLSIFGRACVPSPVMVAVGGLVAGVAIDLVLGVVGSSTNHFMLFLVVGTATAVFVFAVTTWLAVFLVRNGWEPGKGSHRREK